MNISHDDPELERLICFVYSFAHDYVITDNVIYDDVRKTIIDLVEKLFPDLKKRLDKAEE